MAPAYPQNVDKSVLSCFLTFPFRKSLLFGLLFFPVMLFGMLGAFPLYVTKALGVIGILLYPAILAAWSGLLSARARRLMWRGLLAAAVCAGV